MARIPLTSGFVVVPEGTYVFRIYEVDYDEDFGKLIVKMVNADGATINERFSLKNADDSWNEKACNAFSYLARVALNVNDADDVDPMELVNHYIKAEVVHTTQPNKNDPSKTVTFANLGNKEPATGFEKEACKRALELGNAVTAQPVAPQPAPTAEVATSSLDLDALLG